MIYCPLLIVVAPYPQWTVYLKSKIHKSIEKKYLVFIATSKRSEILGLTD
jgi:hypothetical protein